MNYNSIMQNKTKHIYFIRHGETDANKNKITQGRELDLPLNDAGIKQAEITGKYLKKYINVDDKDAIIFTSPQIRAKWTAYIINKELGLEMEQYDELAEIGKGKLSGLNYEDELFQKVTAVEMAFDEKYRDPIERGLMGSRGFHEYMEEELKNENIGLETFESITNNSLKMIEMIKKSSHKKVIVVSHSGLLTVIIHHILNLINADISIKIDGNKKNGKNCWISRFNYDMMEDKFQIITAPNTEHLTL